MTVQDAEENQTELLHCSASARKDELLAKVGGKEILHAAVDLFYERLLVDPELGKFFHGSNILLLKWHQFNFMSIAFAKVPEDLDVDKLITDKHKRLFEMGLNEKHFDLMIGHLRTTFEELKVDQQLTENAIRTLHHYRSDFQRGANVANSVAVGSARLWQAVHVTAAIAAVALVAWRYVTPPATRR